MEEVGFQFCFEGRETELHFECRYGESSIQQGLDVQKIFGQTFFQLETGDSEKFFIARSESTIRLIDDESRRKVLVEENDQSSKRQISILKFMGSQWSLIRNAQFLFLF